MWYKHTVEYYCARKRKEILPTVRIMITLGGHYAKQNKSESQRQECLISFICVIKKSPTEAESSMVLANRGGVKFLTYSIALCLCLILIFNNRSLFSAILYNC